MFPRDLVSWLLGRTTEMAVAANQASGDMGSPHTTSRRINIVKDDASSSINNQWQTTEAVAKRLSSS